MANRKKRTQTKKKPSPSKISKGELYARQSIEDMQKMKGDLNAFRAQIKTMRALATRRANLIDKGYDEKYKRKWGRGYRTVTRHVEPYSYALEKFRDAMKKRKEDGVIKQLSKMDYLQLLSEWRVLSSFLTSETSTLAGIKDVNRRQDLMLFGPDKKGSPIGTMTDEERKVFWALYDEFKSQDSTLYSLLQSKKTLWELGTMANDKDSGFWAEIQKQAKKPAKKRDLIKLLNYAREQLVVVKDEQMISQALEEMSDEDALYSGAGIDLPF